MNDAPERLVAVYDANILYSAVLCDLFLRVATAGLVRAHWTDQIHEEWIRAVLRRRTATSPIEAVPFKVLIRLAGAAVGS
ncbi:MAG: hypothetical protein EA350_06745 [Gemmatimonadales bacterium]|nr:MAG: hypothetical protein EA350_06745 [Gemmatimonadales bacterium]